jgi:hypothetical protein
MRVRIDEDMKVCPNGQMLELKAGEEHDGPLAVWLAGDSGCRVTVLEEGPDGSLSADLTAASGATAGAKDPAPKSGAKVK